MIRMSYGIGLTVTTCIYRAAQRCRIWHIPIPSGVSFFIQAELCRLRPRRQRRVCACWRTVARGSGPGALVKRILLVAIPPRFRRPRFLILAARHRRADRNSGRDLPHAPPGAAAAIAFSEFLQQVEPGPSRRSRSGSARIEVDVPRRPDAHDRRAAGVPGRELLLHYRSRQARCPRRRAARLPDPRSLSYGAIVTVAAFFGLLCFTVYRTTAGRIPSISGADAGRRARRYVITFQDVAGVDEAKDEVKEIVDFLREPERFSAVGGRIPKGVLLVGPPGTGKTLLARSIAGEAGVPFLFASGSDFVEMYAGVGASRVRRLFRDATPPQVLHRLHRRARRRRPQPWRQLAQPRRARADAQSAARRDGRLRGHPGIVVIAATNRQDILDPALLRPGRFDRQVTVGNPDLRGREAILRVHARKVDDRTRRWISVRSRAAHPASRAPISPTW